MPFRVLLQVDRVLQERPPGLDAISINRAGSPVYNDAGAATIPASRL